jgi:hypothetical protein
MWQNITKKYDLIITNLPQMPCFEKINIDRWGDVDGSKYNVIFIKNLKEHLNPGGIAFILISSLSN